MHQLIIRRGSTETSVACLPGTPLTDALRRGGVYLSAPCGGMGRCGQCAVTLTDGEGTRTVLACRTSVHGDCTVEAPWDEGMSVTRLSGCAESPVTATVDLGTTAIAVRLLNRAGEPVAECRDWNAQRFAGADVISRCAWVMHRPNGLTALADAVRTQLAEMLRSLLAATKLPPSALEKVAVAGNTVMQHILWGLDPVPLSRYPFTPSTLFGSGESVPPLSLPGFPAVPVIPAPCAGAYIGGDIVAGLLHLTAGEALPMYSLLLDLGTNGEMALRTPSGWLCCSAATGPAFEGASVSCGMRAEPGAIAYIDATGDPTSPWRMEVLGGTSVRPAGLCGTGLVDLLAALTDMEAITPSGQLLGPEESELPVTDGPDGLTLHLTGSVALTAGDIRALQLAKAAVAAGIDCLLQNAGITPEAVSRVYLAGGFGGALRPSSLVQIGMLPPTFADRICPAGNTSLLGACRLLTEEDAPARCGEIARQCRILTLSGDPAFEDAFIDHMYFGEEE